MGPRSAALEREVERLRTALNETVDKFEAGMTAAQRKRSELEKEIRKGEAHARHMARLLGKENQQREQAQKRAQELEELLRRAKIALERRLTQQVASGQTTIGPPQSQPALNPAFAPTQEQGRDGIVNAARHEAIERRSARQRESYLAELSDTRHEVRDALERLQINNSLLSEAQQRQINHAALEEERQRALQRVFKRERSVHQHTALLWTMRCVFRSHERRLLLLAWVSLREHARDQRQAIAERKLRRRERVAALAYQCKQNEISLARKGRALRLWTKAVQMHQDAISRAVVKLARAIRKAHLRHAWRKFREANLSARWASRLRDSVHLTWRASLRTRPELKICADAWDLWLRFLRHRQSARKRIAKCEYTLLRKRVRSSLSRWRAFTQLKVRQERKSKSLVSIAAHRNKRLLGLGFSTWVRRSYRASRDAISQSSLQLQGEIITTFQQERKRDAHRAASRLISMLLMRRVQSLWQSGFIAFAANARRLDQRQMTFLRSQLSRAHTKKLLQDLFQTWKDRTHLTRASQQAILRRYFRRMRSAVQRHGKLRRAAHAVSRWFQKDAFARWRFHVYRKVKLASLLHHRRRRAMRTSLSRWVRVSILQGRNNTMDRVADGVASLAKASSARSIVTLFRMRSQERKRAALARLREVAVLTSLQDTSKAIFALANISLRGRANLWDIGRAFSHWKRVTTLPLEAARKIFRSFTASRRRRAFATWLARASASTSAMRRQQLQTGISYALAKRCTRERARKAFAALELHARKQMALRRALRLQCRSLCRFAFATWARASTRTLQTQHAQSILQRASQRQSLLRIMFAIWRDDSFSSKRTRAAAGILQSLFTRALNRACLQSAFDKLLLTARAKSKLSTYKRKLTKLDSSTGKLLQSYKVMDKDRRHLGTLLIAAYIAKHHQMLQLRGLSAFRSLGNASGLASPWRQTHAEYHDQEALSELATCTGSDWASPETFGEDYPSLLSRHTHVPEDVGSGTDQSMVTRKSPPSHCRQQSVALSPIGGSSSTKLSAACTGSSASPLPRYVVARETSSRRTQLQSDHANLFARGHALSSSPLSSSPSSFAFVPKDPSKALTTSTSRHLSPQGSLELSSQSYTVKHRGGMRSSVASEYAHAEKGADSVEAEPHRLLHQRSRRQSYAPASPRHAQSVPRDAHSWSGDWHDDSSCASNFSSSRRRGNQAHFQDANAREHGERTTHQDRVVVLDNGDNNGPYVGENDAEDPKNNLARHRHVSGSPRGDQRQDSSLRSGASSRDRFNGVDNARSQDPKRPFVTIDNSRMQQRSDKLHPTKASRPAKKDKEVDGDLLGRERSVAHWVSTRPEKNKGRLEDEDGTEEEEEEEDVGKESKAISPSSSANGTMQSPTRSIAARREPVLPRRRSPSGSSRKSLSSIEQEVESADAESSHRGSRSSQTRPQRAQLDMRHAERPSYTSERVLGESHDVRKHYRKSHVDDNVGGHLEPETVIKSSRLTEREYIASMSLHHEWPVDHSPAMKITKESISQTHRASPAPSEGLEKFQDSQIGPLRCASAKPFDDDSFDGVPGIAEDTNGYHSKFVSTATERNMFSREVSPHSATSERGSRSSQKEDFSGAARNLQHLEARGDRLVSPRSADSEPAGHLADLLHSTREQLARVKRDQVRMLALQFSEEKSKNDSLASALDRFDNARSHAQKSSDNS